MNQTCSNKSDLFFSSKTIKLEKEIKLIFVTYFFNFIEIFFYQIENVACDPNNAANKSFLK
jgi:hypothetical protein